MEEFFIFCYYYPITYKGVTDMKCLPPISEMEHAFRARDSEYDGLFYVGVKTTGVFCKPSCPARKPLVAHVEYFSTPKDALFSGFRPCRRCRPLESCEELPPWAKNLITLIEKEPSRRLKEPDLREFGLKPATVRRFFLKRFGMTFQEFCRSQRLSKAFEKIKGGSTIDDAAFAHGYESLSGFREAFARKFSRPPGKSRSGDFIRLAWIETPLGPMIAGATEAGICLLEFTERRMLEREMEQLAAALDTGFVTSTERHHEHLKTELEEYFAGASCAFTVPLVYPGTAFQKKVWSQLLRIPYGETRCYEDLARLTGSPGAARAVGRANGMNRIAIVIPCHRVINKDGSPGGYGGGFWRKKYLLDHEKSHRRKNP